MPHPLLIVSQSDYLMQAVGINSHTVWQIVQIQNSWLLQKPTDLDLHSLQGQGISGFSRTRVKHYKWVYLHLMIIFQPSMTQYRNNSTETGCQSPTSPHSQPSYSPSQSPGLSPHSWNSKVFEMDPYHVQQQQQTNALQHQFEQFNMVSWSLLLLSE